MKNGKTMLVLIMGIIMSSCSLEPFDNAPANPKIPDQADMEENSAIFENTNGNSTYVFETNDSMYLNRAGYTLWMVQNINSGDSFEPLKVEVSKQSGRAEAGFGIIFCEQKIEGKSYMLTVLINANGLYTVGKVFDGVFSHVNGGWNSSEFIRKGNGVNNELFVDYIQNTGTFVLKINGYEAATFTVGEKITFKDSRSGYVAVIAHNERFPMIPVKVIYESK